MGDNIYLGDRNGVRTPMQWSADRNAGFSPANPQRLYLPVIIDPEYHYEAVNVETQQQQPALAALVDEAPDRPAQALPGLRPRHAGVPPARTTARCLAFLRRYEERDTSWWWPTSRASPSPSSWTWPRSRAWCRSSCSASAEFPPIGELPYLLTLGPHCVLLVLAWQPQRRRGPSAAERRPAERRVVPVIDDRSPSAGTRSATMAGQARLEQCPARRSCAAALVRRQGPAASRASSDRGHASSLPFNDGA